MKVCEKLSQQSTSHSLWTTATLMTKRKDLFLAAVKDHIPLKKLKGRNPVPWIDGKILRLKKKKNSVCQKRRTRPSTGLREKFTTLGEKVKKLLRESREHFYASLDTGFKSNSKRLWSILSLNSKSHHISDPVFMATAPKTTSDQPHNPPRESADSPAGIAALFNRFFASVFTMESPMENITCAPSDTVMVDLTLTLTIRSKLHLKIWKSVNPQGRMKFQPSFLKRLPQ